MKTLKENSKLIWLTALILLSVVSLVLVSFTNTSKKVNRKVSKYINQYMTDIMNENADNIAVKINGNFKTLEALSLVIASQDDLKSDAVRDLLNAEQEQNKMKLNLVFEDGTSLNEALACEDMASQHFLKSAFNGKNTVSDIVMAKNSKEKEILFCVPVTGKDQKVNAVLMSAYNIQEFTEIIGASVFNGKADSFIAQQDGTLVAKPETVAADNIFTMLKSIVMEEEKTVSKLQKSFANGDTGLLVIGEGKYKRYICYTKVPENNWYSVTIMTANAVESDISNVSALSTDFGKRLIFVFILLLLYMFIIYTRANAKTKMAFKRYKIVAEQSENVVFEYNYGKGNCVFNNVWEEKFGYPVHMDHFIKEMIHNKMIVREDIEVFESAFEELRSGVDTIKKEVRIYDKHHSPLWHEMMMTAIRNRKGKIIKVIGRLLDIDKTKREVEYFKKQAQLDLATGLYNKETTNYMISQNLASLSFGMLSAVLYIDIDDFKEINDTYGHNFGDHLVRKLTDIIKNTLDDNSFAGRVGGDEFVVVLKKIYEVKEAQRFAKKILELAEEVEFPHHKDARLKVSIGIALAPDDGNDPKTLIKCADTAMYEAKSQGKECAVLGKTGNKIEKV